MKTLASLALTCAILTGCGTFTGKTPPSSYEQVLFVIRTNIVQEVVEVPREVWTTNTTVVYATNEANIVITNYIPVFTVSNVVEYVTNDAERYTFETRPEVDAKIQASGAAINLLWPGAGTAFVLVAGGLYGLWSRLRSYKATGQVLVGNIEAIREFIKKVVPDGEKYDDAMVQWLVDNQTQTGAVKTLIEQMVDIVNNRDAKIAAQEMSALLDSLTKKS